MLVASLSRSPSAPELFCLYPTCMLVEYLKQANILSKQVHFKNFSADITFQIQLNQQD